VNQYCRSLQILILLAILPAAAEDLGRLFFNAQERQVLNQKRALVATNTQDVSIPKTSTALEANASLEAKELVPLTLLKVTGQVVRSSGNNTIWINHSPHYKRSRQ
jgi:hypothetical protein